MLYVVQKQDNTAQTVVWPPPNQPPCEKASERSEALRELDVVGHTAKSRGQQASERGRGGVKCHSLVAILPRLVAVE